MLPKEIGSKVHVMENWCVLPNCIWNSPVFDAFSCLLMYFVPYNLFCSNKHNLSPKTI